VQAAGAWRFWVSGDSFYAAHREISKTTKFSFHPAGKWQFRSGTTVQAFITTCHLSPEWLHAVSIQTVIMPGALQPHPEEDEKVTLLDMGSERKQSLNLFVSLRKMDQDPAAPEEGGLFLWRGQLRDGRRVVLHGVNLRLLETERQRSIDRQHETPDMKGAAYSETVWYDPHPELGNVVLVVPATPELF
jgi:hypothetical protein